MLYDLDQFDKATRGVWGSLLVPGRAFKPYVHLFPGFQVS